MPDDPEFDPMSTLPRLDMLNWDLDTVFQSQASCEQYSYFTPVPSQQSASSGPQNSNYSINLPDSSHGSFHIPSDFVQPSPSGGFKPFQVQDPGTIDDNPFADQGDNLGGFGLEIDADGNIFGGFGEEPELPPLSGPEPAAPKGIHGTIEAPHPQQQDDNQNPFMMGEEQPLADAEAFPARKEATPSSTPSLERSSPTPHAVAASRRCRRRKANAMLDRADHISNKELKEWGQNYVENMDAMRKRQKTTSLAQAKRNAMAFMYDNGIANVGLTIATDIQLDHPLAGDFAGRFLRARILGREVDFEPKKRGRSSKITAAFGEDEDQRNVRQRTEEAEIGRYNDNFLLADDNAPELGMEAAAHMSDHHSSMMPWFHAGSRAGSAVPSSIKKPSPMPGRVGSAIRSIERHSNVGSDGCGGFSSHGS